MLSFISLVIFFVHIRDATHVDDECLSLRLVDEMKDLSFRAGRKTRCRETNVEELRYLVDSSSSYSVEFDTVECQCTKLSQKQCVCRANADDIAISVINVACDEVKVGGRIYSNPSTCVLTCSTASRKHDRPRRRAVDDQTPRILDEGLCQGFTRANV